MTVLLAAWLMLATPKHPTAPSVLGEWSIWRISSGSNAVDPPKRENGKLVLKANGTFTSHMEESATVDEVTGTYRVQGNKIVFKGTSTTNFFGKKRSRETLFPLVRRNGLLWDEGYLMGIGSFVYARPGKKLMLPPDKDWPSLGEFWPSRKG